MLNFDIKITDKETRTNLPGPILEKLEPWLKRNNIEYKVLYPNEIPEEWEHGCVFRGRITMRHVVCIVSHMDSSDLTKTAEKMFSMLPEDI